MTPSQIAEEALRIEKLRASTGYRWMRAAYWRTLEGAMFARANGRVCHGPFAGMRYKKGAVCSATLPKLLGSYEREIAAWIDRVCAGEFATIIDVGAAEGYYAVGLALRLAHARVIAYESDAVGQRLLRENAAANGVGDRVELMGFCEPETLARMLDDASGRCLVVLDVEGAEGMMVQAIRPTGRARTTFLIEIHDFVCGPDGERPGEVVRRELGPTHELSEIHSEVRTPADFPAEFSWVPKRARPFALDEYRPCEMSWILATPRTREAA